MARFINDMSLLLIIKKPQKLYFGAHTIQPNSSIGRHFFSYPDYTVGTGVSPVQSLTFNVRKSRTFTAGREFAIEWHHPAPKKYQWHKDNR
jgi:hypothetical protein